MSEPFRLAGVFSVLPTIFGDDGALDPDGIAAVVTATRDAAVAGLTVLGVMGEAAELSEAERGVVLECAMTHAAGLPLIVGVSGDSTGLISERAANAAAGGVAALMVGAARTVGLTDAVAAAAVAGLPIIVQDYPLGSGVTVTVTDLVAVCRAQPLVAGIKAEAPPTSGTIAAVREARPQVGVVGGLGGLFLIDELRAGATGVMTGFALPERLVAIVGAYPADPSTAERDWERLLPLMRFEAFPPLSLVARKEVWRLRGVIGSSRCRRAGAVLDAGARDDIRIALGRASGRLSRRSRLVR